MNDKLAQEVINIIRNNRWNEVVGQLSRIIQASTRNIQECMQKLEEVEFFGSVVSKLLDQNIPEEVIEAYIEKFLMAHPEYAKAIEVYVRKVQQKPMKKHIVTNTLAGLASLVTSWILFTTLFKNAKPKAIHQWMKQKHSTREKLIGLAATLFSINGLRLLVNVGVESSKLVNDKLRKKQ